MNTVKSGVKRKPLRTGKEHAKFMFAVSPVVTTPTAISVLPSALTAPASDKVSTRLTSAAVSAPLSDTQLGNDPKSQPALQQPAPVAVQTQTAAYATTAGTTENTNTGGPSSAFLAQLISQSDESQMDNQIALSSSFTRFSPAPTYNAFVGYSIVKYRPSDAGLPSPYASAAAPAQNDNVQNSTVANDYQAYSTTQSRNLANLAPSLPQIVVAG